MTLEDLKNKERIICGCYWENFKFIKDFAQMNGNTHPKVKSLTKEVEEILKEWHEIKNQITELENYK